MKQNSEKEQKMPLSKRNYLYMLISVLICALGYGLMVGGGAKSFDEFNAQELYSFRRITLSVILVLSGHAFMIYALMCRPKKG